MSGLGPSASPDRNLDLHPKMIDCPFSPKENP